MILHNPKMDSEIENVIEISFVNKTKLNSTVNGKFALSIVPDH